MFRKYGILGLAMILIAQVNFFLNIQPLNQWYFPIIWFGYILLIDAIIFKLRGRSLISNQFGLFLVMLLLSALAWTLFEYVGYVIGNWHYTGLEGFGSRAALYIFASLSFATVIPAVFETALLLKTIHLFDGLKLEHRHRITKRSLHGLIITGILMLALTLLLPGIFYPLIWLAFFLILDPINYLHGKPSIISHLKERRLVIPLSLFVGATLCGFLWELWNYYAIPQWHYTIPFLGFLKVFEMPILGYLGYGPFGLELYSMYHFLMGLLYHRGIYIFKY
jgi:hypothetical protein